jgi:hypothetical protein
MIAWRERQNPGSPKGEVGIPVFPVQALGEGTARRTDHDAWWDRGPCGSVVPKTLLRAG